MSAGCEASGFWCDDCDLRMGDGQDHEPTDEPIWRAHVYGSSRSGKTLYATPVMLLGPSNTRPQTHSVVRSFLFLPCEQYPLGELNPPDEVWNSNLTEVEAALDGAQHGDGRIEAWRGEFRHQAIRATSLTVEPPGTPRAEAEAQR